MQGILSKLFNFVLRPFVKELPLFLCLTSLLGISSAFLTYRLGQSSYSLYIFAQAEITAYLLALIVSLFNGLPAKILRVMILAWGVIISIIEITCLVSVKAHMSPDFAAALRGTNVQEANEFVAVYGKNNVFAFIGINLFVALLIYYLSNQYLGKFYKQTSKILLLITVVCALLVWRNPGCLLNNPIKETYDIVNAGNFDSSLLNTSTNVAVERPNDLPDNIVLIIGESLSKRHSSLYGYEKPTNTMLQQLVDSGNVIVFTQVNSPAVATVPAFKTILNTSQPGDEHWYQSHNLPTIFKRAGYTTAWISNQSKYGWNDNYVSPQAQLCDTVVFNGKYGGRAHVNFDGELLPLITSVKTSIKHKQFDIVHLIGSHQAYYNRYPEDRVKFTADDYKHRKVADPQMLAQYDNSVAYNDSVVAEIMNLYHNDDAIVIYFPDHGEDVFDTDPEYAGHAIPESQASMTAAKDIPFIVYLSPSFKNKHAEIADKIATMANTKMSTADFTLWLTNLLGIKIIK